MSSGIARHCHHDKLFDLVWDYEKSAYHIRTKKPREEQTLRMRLFALIPTERLSPVLAQAVAEGTRLRAESIRLWDEGTRLWAESIRLWTEGTRLRDESDRLRDESLKTHVVELEALHAELCHDCTWDGKTIFTRQKVDGEWY